MDGFPDPWSRRLVGLLAIGLALAVPLMWASSYFQVTPSEALSYQAADASEFQWCDPATQGLGVRCFGDYRVPVRFIREGDVWNHPTGTPIPYTATGMVPYAAAAGLEQTVVGPRGTLFLYLVLMAVFMLTPAVLAARRAGSWPGRVITVLLLGAAAAPVLIIFDRGGDVGFVIPFLLAFGLWLGRDPPWVAPAAVVVAASIRPQYILLALAFVALRRWRALAASIVVSVAVGLSAFAIWPGGFTSNVSSWWRTVATHSGVRDPVGDYPSNLSATRSVGAIARGVGLDSVVGFLRENPLVPGALLVLGAVVVLAWKGPSMPRAPLLVVVLALPALVPSVSFLYYLAFVPVIAALIVAQPAVPYAGDPAASGGAGVLARLAPSGAPWCGWAWALIVVIALSMAPIPLPAVVGGHTWVMENIGLLWLVTVCAALVAPLFTRYATTASQSAR